MRLPVRPTRQIVPPDMMGMVSLAFLLLIFFVVAGDPAASLPRGVRPPVAGVMGRIDTAGTPLVVDRDGRIYWQGQPVADAELAGVMAARPHVRGSGTDEDSLALAADGRTDTVRVASVLALLRQAGLKRVKVILTDAARANAFGRGVETTATDSVPATSSAAGVDEAGNEDFPAPPPRPTRSPAPAPG